MMRYTSIVTGPCNERSIVSSRDGFEETRIFQIKHKTNTKAERVHAEWANREANCLFQPTGVDQLNLVADYAYQGDRFKDRQQPTPLQVIAGLGSAETAGIGGRLMDRCLDTLDYDSLLLSWLCSLIFASHSSRKLVVLPQRSGPPKIRRS